jgi:hypothetical protein
LIRTVKGPFSGRIRLTIFIAIVAAFLLVPAAGAFANGNMILSIEGTGSGEISSVGGFEGGYEGTPPIECSYESPGPQTGTCVSELSNEGEGLEAVYLAASPTAGSEFVGWLLESGEVGYGCQELGNPLTYCLPYVAEGEGNVEVVAVFEAEEPETTEFPLTVSKSGTGTGTVTSSPSGIDCGSECSAEFEEGDEVVLSQSAATGSEFMEWTGACAGSGACEVTMDEAQSVGAKFDLIPRTLSVATAGAGSGEVKCKFNAGTAGACTSPQPNGTAVEVIATANSGSEFAGFSGGTGSASACATSPCSFTITANSALTATFDLEPTPEYELEISTDGTGTGEVECEVNGGPEEPCEAEYAEGTEVALVPVAETGSEFTEWGGDCTGTGACELTMDADKSVTATFDEEPTPEYDLTIAKAGTGSGSVTCDGSACAPTYEEGEEITLAASAASGSSFSGWSGGGCSGTGTCLVTITADTTVTATFTANPPPPTCATDPSLCPPAPAPTPTPAPAPTEGKAKAAATAKVKSGKAELKLTCKGGPCKGTVKLTAKVKQGKKTKNLVIGQASFSIAAGASATVKVKLSGPAKTELGKGKTLKAKTSGTGLTASTVKVKPAKKA